MWARAFARARVRLDNVGACVRVRLDNVGACVRVRLDNVGAARGAPERPKIHCRVQFRNPLPRPILKSTAAVVFPLDVKGFGGGWG